jgi:hypothetical protein
VTSNDTYLDRLMTERGLENHQLAKLAKASRQSIWKLRTGLTRMLPQWAKRLAPHLEVSWQELVDGAPAPVDPARVEWSELFDALDEDQRQALLVVGSGMARRNPPRSNGPDPPLPFVMGGRVTEKPAKEDCQKNVAARSVGTVTPVRRR